MKALAPQIVGGAARQRAAAGDLRAPSSGGGRPPRGAAALGAITCSSAQPRRLILMRHADSVPAQSFRGRDHDRPCTPAGLAAAAAVAGALRAAGWLPQVVLASNALRTRQTLDAMRAAAPEALEDADAHLLGSLYALAALDGQTRGRLSALVAAEAGAAASTVLCLGHNMGWSEAASSFAGAPLRLGNCHAALLEGGGDDWAEALLDGAPWRLVGVVTPEGTVDPTGELAAAARRRGGGAAAPPPPQPPPLPAS